MPKISLIMPVYNAEKYLAEALESVFRQTFKDYEVICVDDGSTDNSLKILQEFASKHENMTVITQENKRVSAARNAGFNVSKGEYVQFMDADDVLRDNAFELAYKKISETNADMVVFCYERLIKDKIVGNNIHNLQKYIKKPEDLELFFQLMRFIWDKLYKKDFLLKNNIYFKEDVIASEDIFFMLDCFSKEPAFECMQEVLYIYRDAENSSTHRWDWTKLSLDAFYIILESDLYKTSSQKFKDLILIRYIISLSHWYIVQKKYRKENKARLHKLIDYLYENYSSEVIDEWIDFLKYKIGYTKTKFDNIFSVNKFYFKNEKHIVVTIFGLKIKKSIAKNMTIETSSKKR